MISKELSSALLIWNYESTGTQDRYIRFLPSAVLGGTRQRK
jgi:hypothetical protein